MVASKAALWGQCSAGSMAAQLVEYSAATMAVWRAESMAGPMAVPMVQWKAAS